MRLYGSAEHFRQVFSSINNTPTTANPDCTYRCGETPTRFSHSPENELGAVAHWSQPLGAGLLLVAGADTHDLRVWDNEQTYGATAALTNLARPSARFRRLRRGMWVHKGWTATASGRLDWFQNYDGHQVLWNGSTWIPRPLSRRNSTRRVFDPRVGLSRKLFEHWALTASAFAPFARPRPTSFTAPPR